MECLKRRRALRAAAPAISEALLAHRVWVGMPDGFWIASFAARLQERLGPASFAGRDLLHGAAGGDGLVLRQHSLAVTFTLIAVPVLDEQPVVALLALTAPQAYQDPAALQLAPCKREFELTFAQRAVDVAVAFGRPEAPVPQHD